MKFLALLAFLSLSTCKMGSSQQTVSKATEYSSDENDVYQILCRTKTRENGDGSNYRDYWFWLHFNQSFDYGGRVDASKPYLMYQTRDIGEEVATPGTPPAKVGGFFVSKQLQTRDEMIKLVQEMTGEFHFTGENGATFSMHFKPVAKEDVGSNGFVFSKWIEGAATASIPGTGGRVNVGCESTANNKAVVRAHFESQQ